MENFDLKFEITTGTGPNKTFLMTQIACPLAFEDDGMGGNHTTSAV